MNTQPIPNSSNDDFLTSVGTPIPSPLTITEYADAKRLPEKYLREKWGAANSKDGLTLPYHKFDGTIFREKVRKSLSHDVKPMMIWRGERGLGTVPYGMHLLPKGCRQFWLVEGESDTQTLHYRGLPVLGISGADGAKPEFAKNLFFLNADGVAVVREPGESGDKFVAALSKWPEEIRKKFRVITLSDGIKDVSELHQQYPEGDAFMEILRTAYNAAQPIPEPKETITPVIPNTEKATRNAEIVGQALRDAGIAHYARYQKSDGGYQWNLKYCTFDYAHEGGSSVAVHVGADGKLGFCCKHPGCEENHWAQFRAKLEKLIGKKLVFEESPMEPPHPAESEEWNEPARYSVPESESSQAESSRPSDARHSAETSDLGFKFAFPAVQGTKNDYVMEPINGRDGWFPLGAPSVIAAPSGGGKTTWLFELLQKQYRGETFYGHRTSARPYLVLAYDRGKLSGERTMERMGLDEATFPIKYLPLATGRAAIQIVIKTIEIITPMPQVVFIEGVDMLVKDVSKPEFVIPFLNAMQLVSEYYHIAVLMSVGAPKIKRGEGYVAKRDSILGSEKWGRMCETVAVLEYVQGDDTDDRRYLFVLPRNNRPEKFNLKFNDSGRLAIDTSGPIGKSDPKERDDISFYRAWVTHPKNPKRCTKAGVWFTSLDVETVLGSSHSTTGYRLKDALTKKVIITKRSDAEKESTGGRPATEYRWNDSVENPFHVPDEAGEELTP